MVVEAAAAIAAEAAGAAVTPMEVVESPMVEEEAATNR
jgi:hypothetical protein